MIYLLNSMILPLKGGDEYTVKAREISIQQLKEMLKGKQFVSAIGHESTARLLSSILGVEVPYQRISVYASHGDVVIAFQLKKRLEEGKVISNEKELEEIGYSIWMFSIE